MPVTSDQPGPYPTKASVLSFLDRYRNRGMQKPINSDVLGRSGVSESLIPRTLLALQTLDLIDDQGNPTEVLEGLRLSPESEYQQNMQAWLKGTYADVFLYVDPSVDDEASIRDAFRSYQPIGQQGRMVALFIALCTAAGLRPESTEEKKPKSASTSRKNPGRPRKKKPPLDDFNLHGVPSAISGLMQSLPVEGSGWTTEKRRSFITTFEAVLDFCFPVVTVEEQSSESEQQNDDS